MTEEPLRVSRKDAGKIVHHRKGSLEVRLVNREPVADLSPRILPRFADVCARREPTTMDQNVARNFDFNILAAPWLRKVDTADRGDILKVQSWRVSENAVQMRIDHRI
jgi:hypothetical protein